MGVTASGPRKFWGWGVEGGGLGEERSLALARMAWGALGLAGEPRPRPAPRIEDVAAALPAARIALPDGIPGDACPLARASHTYGKAYRDIVRALAGDFAAAPDAVATPASEADLARTLQCCAERGWAAIPYGGGSSVVGGVEARGLRERFPGVVSIDLGRLDRVLEVDAASRAARIQAGALGPAIEAQLRPHGLTLRHFPQSFEWSTLGGWLATRAAGHFATLLTRIDEMAESIRMLTPRGPLETRRLPASGAGPDPNRLILGSEGALGVIVEAWMRVRPRPTFRASATATFASFAAGGRALRALAQSDLYPANCRLLDPVEALLSGAGAGAAPGREAGAEEGEASSPARGRAVLIVAFESADHDVEPWLARAVEILRDHDGAVQRRRSNEADPAETWRRAFLNGPYLRDDLVRCGLVVETFETACHWDRFDAFHDEVVRATEAAAARECGRAIVSARVTHVYPDGPAPYYTVLAPARAGAEVAQWDAIKAATMDAILRAGGTITHHHAVGRDHRPGYDRERPALFADALRAIKRALDPALVLNPGVLIDVS